MVNDRDINKHTIPSITTYVNNYVKFSFICDYTVKVGDKLIKTIVILCTTQYCKKINNIIKGKEVPKHGVFNGLIYKATILHNKRVH